MTPLDRQGDAAAAAEAAKSRAGGAIAVADDGGNLMALERLDGTFAPGAGISIGKARTAAIFKRPTKAFEDIIKNGRTAMVAIEDFTPLQGGVPIVLDGEVVGAIGVSGAASAQQDEEIALVGAAAAKGFGARTAVAPAVTQFEAGQVEVAFARGVPLLEVAGYKIHASRRDAPGMAEVHDRETDVMSAPGATEVRRRTLAALPARHRAAVLIDTEALAPQDVAAGLGETTETVRRRLHQVRMPVRERLTGYFAATTGRP